MKSKINIPKSFFSFLIASFFIWLLINLSKEYTTTIDYQIIYEELPLNKIFQEEPLKDLKVRVKASGFKLLSANFLHRKDLKFSLGNLRYNSKGVHFILPHNQETAIQEQLYKGLLLDKVLQDTIFLNLGSLTSKKVPVTSNIVVNYEPGYDLTSPIKIMPDSVLISGPKLQIEKINKVTTELLELNNVSESQNNTLKIKLPKEYNKVKLSDKNAKIEILVDKFTEGEFLVPFIIENKPVGTKINTFPKKVKIVFKVGLSNFNKISPDSFKVVCDYKISRENDLSYLIPKLELKPNLVSSVRLLPKKIEYLTQK